MELIAKCFVMPEVFCRASMIQLFLDSRQKNAGMTRCWIPAQKRRGNDKVLDFPGFQRIRSGAGSKSRFVCTERVT